MVEDVEDFHFKLAVGSVVAQGATHSMFDDSAILESSGFVVPDVYFDS